MVEPPFMAYRGIIPGSPLRRQLALVNCKISIDRAARGRTAIKVKRKSKIRKRIKIRRKSKSRTS
jgi:hypothetical protein